LVAVFSSVKATLSIAQRPAPNRASYWALIVEVLNRVTP
jgi:hypothetical protein